MSDALAEWQKTQEAEWLVYVAAGVIELGGVRAFNEGDPVPVSHVTRGVVRADQVRPAGQAASLAFEPPTSLPRGTLDQPEAPGDVVPIKRVKAAE